MVCSPQPAVKGLLNSKQTGCRSWCNNLVIDFKLIDRLRSIARERQKWHKGYSSQKTLYCWTTLCIDIMVLILAQGAIPTVEPASQLPVTVPISNDSDLPLTLQDYQPVPPKLVSGLWLYHPLVFSFSFSLSSNTLGTRTVHVLSAHLLV